MVEEQKRLLSEIKNDNHFAFARLFDLYKARIFNFSKRFVLTEENADEIMQMVFVKLWEKRKKIDVSLSLDSYVYALTKNTCLDFLRKIGNDRKALNGFLDSYIFDPGEDLNHAELLNSLEKIIDKLPPRQKGIFILAKLEKKSYDEIAKEMCISKNSVKTQLKLAKSFVVKNALEIHKLAVAIFFLYP